jgi:hypothetical protein
MKKTSKLTLQRSAVRVLDANEAAHAAGGAARNPFDDTIHSHWLACDTHFQSVCFPTGPISVIGR